VNYATPEAFRQALEMRIRNVARTRRQPIARVRQVLVFERFLARIFDELGERVTLKGGAVLELRLERARTTRDIDLRVLGAPDELLAQLRRAAALDLGDFLNFEIAPDTRHPDIEGDGIVYEGRRYRAEARLAGKIYGDGFGVDVAFGDVLTQPPELLDGTDFFSFAGLPRTHHRVYPRTTHVAEKLHAYTMPRARPNSRVKDLPDLALLATTGAFEAADLRRAIEATFGFRRSHPVPSLLPEPSDTWRAPYAAMVTRDDLIWPDLVAVTRAARAFLDPLLAGGEGRWEPALWRWESTKLPIE
jgi:hypothetical protein